MVKQGIVLGHVISQRGIEVDKVKVDLISNLPPPRIVKKIRSFLGQQGSTGDSSRISARSPSPCVGCWPKRPCLNLMKNV
jgi:hypothetical protein